MRAGLGRLNVAAGKFFFRFRNALFPALFAAFLLFLRPKRMFQDPALDRFLVFIGFAVTLLGEGVRLATIGFEYIERGGKQGRVHASRLVNKGVYGISRNPMYVGNMLIATGIVMVSGAPLAYFAVLPFFLFVYQAIVAAEEEFLRAKFGQEYREYCARVPRFLPSLRAAPEAFSGTRFNWRRPLKQDLSTLAWIAMVLIALPCWRQYFSPGWEASKARILKTALLELGVLVLYGGLVLLKKRRSPLFYDPGERS